MTVQNIIEQAILVFPTISESLAIKELSDAQKKFAYESRILRTSDDLESIASNNTFTLPTDCLQLIRVAFYDIDGNELIYGDVRWKIEDSNIIFYSTLSTFTGFPTIVNKVTLFYIKEADDLTSVSSVLEVPTMFTEGVQAKMMERLYSMYPVDIVTQNGAVKTINTQLINYFKSVYAENVISAKKYINSINSSGFNVPHIEKVG